MDLPEELFESDFTPDFVRALIAEYGDMGKAARDLAPRCRSTRYVGRRTAWKTVQYWMRCSLRDEGARMGLDLSRPADQDRLNRVDDLIDHANVPLDAIGRITGVRLKSYAGYIKNKDGEAERVPMHSTTIDLAPPNPDFPVIQPAPTTSLIFAEPPRILRRTRTEVVISDIQAGWLRDPATGALQPIHDPAAIDVAQQITNVVAPRRIVFIGDVADLPMFSRWEQYPEYAALQESVNVVHDILGTFIASAGLQCTERVMIGSNHDHRIEKSVLAWNKHALGVRRAGDVDGWPVFSLGYLARFDDLGLQWSGQYPGGEFYLLDDLVVMHAPPKAKEFRGSVIHGHTHKLTRTTVVQHSRAGRCTDFVYDIGCLCHLGVTDDKFRLLVTRVPSDRGRTDWAQGIAVVSIVEASGSKPAFHSVEQVSIQEGRAMFGGQLYTTRMTA